MSPSASDFPGVVEVVVEIPRGSRNKYEFDEEAGVFRLDRVLALGRPLQLRLRLHRRTRGPVTATTPTRSS